MKKRELIIIGGGPAGLNAAVYAARYNIDAEVLTELIGGVVFTVHEICNFLSYPSITGAELVSKMEKHVKSLGVPITITSVQEIKKQKKGFLIKTSVGDYFAKKVIFATGTYHKELNAKGEKQFIGRGISYCATCDATFFKKKIVGVVGGGDAALTSALILSEHASKVYLIHRRKEFRGEPAWVDSVKSKKNIFLKLEEEVSEIFGKEKVEGVKFKSGKNLKLDGLFIEIGALPELRLIKSLNVKTSKKGYILVDEHMQTNVKGFYAAGDVVDKDFRQIATAISDGAIAVLSVYSDLKKGE